MSLSQKGAKIMNEYELIDTARGAINYAERAMNAGDHGDFADHMQTLLDLLIEELAGSPPAAQAKPAKTFNPEQVLEEISIAIKHRTISHTERWKIIYYRERLTCVPNFIDVPSQIVLHEFTERMVQRGFSVIYWNQLKQNVVKLYKELQKG